MPQSPIAGTPNFPLGFETVSISVGNPAAATDFRVDAVDIPSVTTRVINRPDEYGDAADWQVRYAGEKVTGSITLQRATLTTAWPNEGTEFTYDFDRSGTPSTLCVMDIKNARSKDAADTIEITVLVETYQG